ncbi:MAG: PVC-type heme-binding CxxCH protein [Phycisphaeraceae bacterium]
MTYRALLSALMILATLLPAKAAEPDFADQLPRIKPLEPAEAIKAFKIAPGYAVELAASEPVVSDPIAMCFDEDGKLFVVEMRDYPESQPKDGGCVRLLIDTNDDGVFDKSTIYIDKLAWPTAVFCWDGGIFVAAAPDILYCKDTNGDGVADYRKVIYTGFGTQNVQGLLNSFRWGLDNRIHGAASSNGGTIKTVATTLKNEVDAPSAKPQAAVNVRGRDFAFDPRTLKFEATSGGAQHGMCFDDFGRKFVCSNSDHLQQVMFELEDVERNPFLAAPGPRVSIAEDGPQAEVYRISPVEPWRILRTELRVKGAVPGPVEGGGRAAGYFTGSTGVTIYRGDALPELRGMAFIGDVGSNIVHRKKLTKSELLTQSRIVFSGERIDGNKEFLASTDIWFRPVQFGEGPDGCLYVLDMYREVIEHPASLPPAIKKHLDLTSGQGKGRIWRIVPAKDYTRRVTLAMSKAATEDLAYALAYFNAWQRETAARLLYTRQDPAAIPILRQQAGKFRRLTEAVHDLYVLRGLDALDEPTLLRSLESKWPSILEHAINLAVEVNPNSPALRTALDKLADHPSADVKYQLAWALGTRRDKQKIEPLATILRSDYLDKWMRLAVLSSSLDVSGELLARASEFGLIVERKDDQGVLSALAQMTGRLNRADQVEAVKRAAETIAKTDQRLSRAITDALADGLARAVKDPLAALPATPAPKPINNEPRREKEHEAFEPALKLEGDVDKGSKLFAERCAVCHKLDGTGNEVGPNLAAMAARGAEAILLNVIDPNREVNPLFTSYTIRMKDGEIHTGLITGETGTSLEIVGPKAEKHTLLRVDIESIQSTGLSLMPEALEQGMDKQGMADLIAYLMKAR